MSLSVDTPPKLAGKKRKYSMAVEEEPDVKLKGKLHHYWKEMCKAAKKCKTFETQRLVKKLKDLRKSTHVTTVQEEIIDLETQLESLKRTDHGRIAYLVLSSKIHKDKILKSNNVLMTSLASAMFTSTNANIEARHVHVKVESRLLSSKILAAEAQGAVKGLRAILAPGMTLKAHGDVKSGEVPNNNQEQREEEIDKKAAVDARLGSKSGDDSSDEGDIKETAILGEVLDEAEDMVDDNGWESGSIDDIEHVESDEDVVGCGSPRQKTKEPSSSSLLKSLDASSSAAASTFLPSLSVGYIKGGSDSDIDQSDGETAANRKKNRRGQRARQTIWEKKYGRNAKHIKKQREDLHATTIARSLGKHPDKGWDRRRRDNSESANVSMPGTSQKRLVQRHSRGQHEIHPPSEKPTHPSWEAKRKLKEKESARILPSQGKKIVFT